MVWWTKYDLSQRLLYYSGAKSLLDFHPKVHNSQTKKKKRILNFLQIANTIICTIYPNFKITTQMHVFISFMKLLWLFFTYLKENRKINNASIFIVIHVYRYILKVTSNTCIIFTQNNKLHVFYNNKCINIRVRQFWSLYEVQSNITDLIHFKLHITH